MQQLVVGEVEILPVDQSFSLGSEIEKGGGRKVMYATGHLPSTPPPSSRPLIWNVLQSFHCCNGMKTWAVKPYLLSSLT